MNPPTLTPPTRPAVPTTPDDESSVAHTASSANQRLAIPLNLERWADLPEDLQQSLTWFHQYALDQGLTLDQCAKALGYDRTVVYRALHGMYGPPRGKGNWDNIAAAIDSFRRLAENRATIQKVKFEHNSISRLVFAGLDYSLANNSITKIVGESGIGKSVAVDAWREENNHGRSVKIITPVKGGAIPLMHRLMRAIGGNARQSLERMTESAYRAFNEHRILIVDEAHRLIKNEQADCLEMMRDIHDQTGCALAIVATHRLDKELVVTDYQYEQVLGRIGLPVYVPKSVPLKDISPILRQYFKNPSEKVVSTALEIANELGHIRILVERLKVASRIAAKAGKQLSEEHFFKALKIVKQMGGAITTEEQ